MPIFLYLKLHWKTFLALAVLTALPLVALYKFTDFPTDHIHYLFLTLLLAIKITFMQDKIYKKNLKNVVKDSLKKELARVPSHGEIIGRIEDYVNGRNFILVLNFVLILTIFVFKNFI